MPAVRLYLDIDGCLLHDTVSPWGATVRRTVTLSDGAAARVRYTVELVRAIVALSSEVQIVWVTTWLEGDALERLAGEIGLPTGERLPVPARDRTGRLPADWKRDAVLADQRIRPGAFVWVDDEDATEIVTDRPHLVIKPRPHLGITPREVDAICEFAAQHA